jgi:hypothetical protein
MARRDGLRYSAGVPASSAFATRKLPLWLLGAAVLIFAVYAANFFYFFVDDEGIPLVYARNLLRGRGLSYSPLEGRVEGYSDFLHVLIASGELSLLNALHASPLAIFFVGKALSLASGVGVMVCAFFALRRIAGASVVGAAAGLAFLATAGPLAVWACSSLETAMFALSLAVLGLALQIGNERAGQNRADAIAVLSGAFALLDRIDGFVYAGIAVAAFWIAADSHRRRTLQLHVVLPLTALFVIYHGWRRWYFGDWLTMPLYAKVLYKLHPVGELVTKPPLRPYSEQFVDVFGFPLIVLIVGIAVFAVRFDRTVRAYMLAALLGWAYAALVGDWMFGLRMFTASFAWLAIGAGASLSVLSARMPRAGVLATLTMIALMGWNAPAFEAKYEREEKKPSFLAQPSRDPGLYFGSYYDLLEQTRRAVGERARISYNQAGFVPYMLDLDNIDTLGICSRFYAKLPTTDVFFTEVGRYAPLRNGPLISASDAYLLYYDVPYVIQRNDLLQNANHGDRPQFLMDGYYERAEAAGSFDTVYRRTARPTTDFRRDPTLFTENLAHTSRIRAASFYGQPVDDIGEAFPFLRGGLGRVVADSSTSFDVTFSPEDQEVSSIGWTLLTANVQASVRFELLSAKGEVVAAFVQPLEKNRPMAFNHRLEAPVPAAELRVTTSASQRASVWFDDLRVMGQTRELAAYIRQNLRF